MDYEVNNLKGNEVNLSMNKDLDNNDDLPYSYQIPKNDYSDNEDIHFSLLKELEDKWSYIERNKIKIPQRKVNDLNDSNSLKTKNRSRIEDCRVIIEESKKKYQEQKKNCNYNNNEDFDSFVKRKNNQLEKLSSSLDKTDNKHYHNDYNRSIDYNRKLRSTFLKKDNTYLINNQQRIKGNLSFNNKQPTFIQIGCNDYYQQQHNKRSSELTEKMKSVYCIITNTDSNGLKLNNDKGNLNKSQFITKKNDSIMNEIIENNYTMAKLKINFDNIMSQMRPKNNNNNEYMKQIPNSTIIHKLNHCNSNSKDDMSCNISYCGYKRSKEQRKGKNMPIKLLKKFNESTVILNTMLPMTKTRPNHKVVAYPHKTIMNNNRSISLNHNNNSNNTINSIKQQVIYARNDFKAIENSLHSITSPKIRRIMNM